jgi:polynucleotide 5'-hydroxyl-kinase GRC3/NOL9
VLSAVRGAPGVCLVVGDVDTGKSTFSEALGHRCVRAGIRTALVDADLGQSRLGPPTTIAYEMLRGDAPADSSAPGGRGAWWFVGDTSPQYRPLAAVVGTLRMAQAAAASGAECSIVDTCGWVRGSAAVALKEAKLALLRPRHVVALQRGEELEPILAPCRFRRDMVVHRLRPSPRVRPRSQERRRAHRQRMFAEHFADAVEREFALDAVVISGAPVLCGRRAPEHVRALAADALNADVVHAEVVGDRLILVSESPPSADGLAALAEAFPEEQAEVYTTDEFRGRIAGVSDADGRFVALAMVTSIDFPARRLRLRAPDLPEPGPIGLTLGCLRVAPDFSELGRRG